MKKIIVEDWGDEVGLFVNYVDGNNEIPPLNFFKNHKDAYDFAAMKAKKHQASVYTNMVFWK